MQVIANIVPNPNGKECKVRFKSSDAGHINWGYILWKYLDGKYQVSENRTLETMRLAQNWVIDSSQILEGNVFDNLPYILE